MEQSIIINNTGTLKLYVLYSIRILKRYSNGADSTLSNH